MDIDCGNVTKLLQTKPTIIVYQESGIHCMLYLTIRNVTSVNRPIEILTVCYSETCLNQL